MIFLVFVLGLFLWKDVPYRLNYFKIGRCIAEDLREHTVKADKSRDTRLILYE